jgi:hypothetical protein
MTTKPKVTSSSTANNSSVVDLKALIGMAPSVTGGTAAVYTKQEGDADVQNVFQQLLGRSAAGNDYAKALGIAMKQSSDTSSAGRQQAIANFVQNLPEYQAREDNKYLDAMYNAVAADVRKVRQ